MKTTTRRTRTRLTARGLLGSTADRSQGSISSRSPTRSWSRLIGHRLIEVGARHIQLPSSPDHSKRPAKSRRAGRAPVEGGADGAMARPATPGAARDAQAGDLGGSSDPGAHHGGPLAGPAGARSPDSVGSLESEGARRHLAGRARRSRRRVPATALAVNVVGATVRPHAPSSLGFLGFGPHRERRGHDTAAFPRCHVRASAT